MSGDENARRYRAMKNSSFRAQHTKRTFCTRISWLCYSIPILGCPFGRMVLEYSRLTLFE